MFDQFQIRTSQGKSTEFATNENRQAAIFNRMYMVVHMFAAVFNLITILLAKKLLVKMMQGMFYFSIIMIFLLSSVLIYFLKSTQDSIDSFKEYEENKFEKIFTGMAINEGFHILVYIIFIVEYCILFKEDLCRKRVNQTDLNSPGFFSYFNRAERLRTNASGALRSINQQQNQLQTSRVLIQADQNYSQQKLDQVVKNLKLLKLCDENMVKLRNLLSSKQVVIDNDKIDEENVKVHKQVEDEKGEVTCPICQEYFKRDDICYETFCDKQVEIKSIDSDIVIKKKVPHVFHQQCLMKWFKSGHLSCPNCRTDLFQKLQTLNRILPEVQLVANDIEQQREQQVEQRQNGVQDNLEIQITYTSDDQNTSNINENNQQQKIK
eukprot:403359254